MSAVIDSSGDIVIPVTDPNIVFTCPSNAVLPGKCSNRMQQAPIDLPSSQDGPQGQTMVFKKLLKEMDAIWSIILRVSAHANSPSRMELDVGMVLSDGPLLERHVRTYPWALRMQFRWPASAMVLAWHVDVRFQCRLLAYRAIYLPTAYATSHQWSPLREISDGEQYYFK